MLLFTTVFPLGTFTFVSLEFPFWFLVLFSNSEQKWTSQLVRVSHFTGEETEALRSEELPQVTHLIRIEPYSPDISGSGVAMERGGTGVNLATTYSSNSAL